MANNLKVTYKGNTIHSASASGSATLKTGGTWCEDDIGLSYEFDEVKAVLAVTVTNGTATSVTATKDGSSVSLIQTGGTWFAELPSFGTWIITITDGTHSNTASVSATQAGLYTVSIYMPDVPSAYTQLEYLQGSMKQKIDTGYVPTTTTKCQVTAMFLEIGGWQVLFGASGDSFCVERDSETLYFAGAIWGITNWNDRSKEIEINLDTKYTFELDIPTNSFSAGGTTRYYTRGTAAPSQTIGLFTRGTDNWSSGQVRIYDAKIFSSSTLVRNFYPVIRNSDSVVGMYDTVNNVFYANAGTGTFTAGPAV